MSILPYFTLCQLNHSVLMWVYCCIETVIEVIVFMFIQPLWTYLYCGAEIMIMVSLSQFVCVLCLFLVRPLNDLLAGKVTNPMARKKKSQK